MPERRDRFGNERESSVRGGAARHPSVSISERATLERNRTRVSLNSRRRDFWREKRGRALFSIRCPGVGACDGA